MSTWGIIILISLKGFEIFQNKRCLKIDGVRREVELTKIGHPSKYRVTTAVTDYTSIRQNFQSFFVLSFDKSTYTLDK